MDPLAQGSNRWYPGHPRYALGSMSMSAPDRMFLECQTVPSLPAPVDAEFERHVNQHGRLRSATPPTPTPPTSPNRACDVASTPGPRTDIG